MVQTSGLSIIRPAVLTPEPGIGVFTQFGSDTLTLIGEQKAGDPLDSDPRTSSQVPGKSAVATLSCRNKARSGLPLNRDERRG